MTGLVILGFFAAAVLAVSSMVDTVRRYGGLALAVDGAVDAALDSPWPPGPKPRGRRSIASRGHVGTPRRALARGRRAHGSERRGTGCQAQRCDGQVMTPGRR